MRENPEAQREGLKSEYIEAVAEEEALHEKHSLFSGAQDRCRRMAEKLYSEYEVAKQKSEKLGQQFKKASEGVDLFDELNAPMLEAKRKARKEVHDDPMLITLVELRNKNV